MVRSNNQLPTNLPQLQNCIKRDSISYKEEFLLQLNHFQALLQVFQYNSSLYDKNFIDLVTFIAQVSHCYVEELKELPYQLITNLKIHGILMHPSVRIAICKALILIRNKSLISSTDLLPHFLDLFKLQNKNLRDFIKTYIVTDIKNLNTKHHDTKLNYALQKIIFDSIKDNDPVVAKASLDTLITLYHKNIWRDARCVNVIADCCFSQHSKILVAAITFFLGKDEDKGDASDDSSDESDKETNFKVIKEVGLANRVNKSTRKRKKILEKTKQVVEKSKKTRKPLSFNFSAIHLIYDPQSMAEKLLHNLEKVNHRFEVKIMAMNLVSRLIGIHRLFVFNFYSYLQRYLQPHQTEVTKILLFSAQAAHELVPAETLNPIVKLIANNFVSERNSTECMCVGINSIRELCSRCPLAMDEDLLQDLVQYKSYKNKNVSMAAKSLITLYRKLNPDMLKKKDRGRPTEASVEFKALQYGELDAKDYIPGTEVLDVAEPEDDAVEDTNSKSKRKFNHHMDSDSDGWIDVNQSDDNLDILSNDDEEEAEDDDNKKKDNLSPQAAKEKASLVSTNRLLSQKEFERIRAVQLAKEVKASRPKRFTKNEEVELDDLTRKKKEVVSLTDIEKLFKKPRLNKETRLATIMEGRQGREKFGGRKPKMNPHASKKEKEKKKNKAFSMVKHKIIKKKKKRSYQERAASLKRALVKKLKNSK